MKKFVKQLWNFEFKNLSSAWSKSIFYGVILLGVLYVFGEVLLGFSLDIHYSLLIFFKEIQADYTPKTPYEKFQFYFPYIWLSIALVCVFIRLTIIISSYILSRKAIGDNGLNRHMLTYTTSFFVSISFGLLFLLLLSFIAKFFGANMGSSIDIFKHLISYIETLANSYIPSIFKISNYWMALVFTFLLAGLPPYFIHWLTHRFRFFWLVLHRSHHAPQFLHPLGVPPGFSFSFLLTIPAGFLAIICSKIVYMESLVLEVILWNTLAYWFEIFNHSIVHYSFANKNFFVRLFSNFFGGQGVYHLMHHSAKETDQIVNLGGGPFLIWDRVFGTYKKPYVDAPPLGLTNQPVMILNPFRIIFSGVAQLIYEFKKNKNWYVRAKVIFGDIYYIPPISKDFLVPAYNEK